MAHQLAAESGYHIIADRIRAASPRRDRKVPTCSVQLCRAARDNDFAPRMQAAWDYSMMMKNPKHDQDRAKKGVRPNLNCYF